MKEFKLDNEPKIRTGFSVPENYFENFSAKLLQELPKEEPRVISLYQKRKKILFAVAAVLVLALSLPIYNSFFTTTQEPDSTSMENYLAYQPNITQYDLISELEADDLVSLNETSSADKTVIEEHLLKGGNVEQLILE
ncbi:hypothetical protein [Flavobacterium succinicans]|uniref:Uncharacterized protein n=1 Tax=Flavobacterium succinicans TaxID=29536 RepID=A0A199XSG0_9FLAO|nr:hypothetical protein [Flavobacterium succinicans]OAZ04186.1 hypothetical protein FLB_11790 [Flavobacterium succinicans]